MKVFTPIFKSVNTLTNVTCDICGKPCLTGKLGDIQEYSYAELSFSFGYTSGRDGDRGNVDICTKCFGELFDKYMDRWYKNGVVKGG